jgi:hypothetical protein
MALAGEAATASALQCHYATTVGMLGAARPLSPAGSAAPVGCSGGRIPDFFDAVNERRKKGEQKWCFASFM